MKNLKKYLAAFVVVAMLVTMMAPMASAAASKDWEKEADALYNAGLYKGTDPNAKVLALDENATREQAVTMILRIFGLEDEAAKMDADEAKQVLASTFSDAAQVSGWAVNNVAYAAKNKMYQGRQGNGAKNAAAPQDKITGKEYITLVLRNLGYTVSAADFATCPDMLVSKGGLSADDAATLGTDSSVTRRLLVGITASALQATMSSGKVLVNYLVEETKTVDAAKATDLGYKPTTTVTVTPSIPAGDIKVVSATASGNQITAVLNGAPTPDPVGGDFAVTQAINGAAATSVTATVYGWTASTKTATLVVPAVTPTTTLQKVVYTVAYKTGAAVTTNEVLLISGVSIASIEALNSDGTTAALAGATSVKTDISAKVTFSVAVADADVNAANFQILKTDGTILPVKFSLSDDKKVVTVIPTTSMAANTDYKLVIANVNAKDGSGKIQGTSTTSFKTGDFVTVTKLTANNTVVDTTLVKGIFYRDVANSKNLKLTFPTNLNPATVSGTTVKILDKAGKQVPAFVSYQDDVKAVVIELGAQLGDKDDQKDYSLIVSGVKTLGGKDVENYKFDFTVSDDYAPVVKLADGVVVNAQTNVYGRLNTEYYAGVRKVGFKLNIAFRAEGPGDIQDMMSSTLNSDNVWLEEASSQVKVPATLSWDTGLKVLSLVPTSDLKENTEYRLVILPDVKNALGLKAQKVTQATTNGGSGQNFGIDTASTKYTQTFTTNYYVRPVVTSASIAQGAVDIDATTKSFTVVFSKKISSTPLMSTIVSNDAIVLKDASADENIDLGNGGTIVNGNLTGDGNNGCAISIADNTLSMTFTKDLSNLTDDHANGGLIAGETPNVDTNNRKGHTFQLIVSGEASKGANALRDTDGNTMADDYTLSFTVPASDKVAPTVSSALAMANADGVGSTEWPITLSKTDTVTNVQGSGSAVGNESFKVIFSEKMAQTTTNANRNVDPTTLTSEQLTALASYANSRSNYTFDVYSNANPDGAPIATIYAGSVTNPSDDEKTFIITPASTTDIPDDAKVRLNVSSTVTDKAANTIGSTQRFTFCTGKGPEINTALSQPVSTDSDAQGYDKSGNLGSMENNRRSIKLVFKTLEGNGNINKINAILFDNYIVIKDSLTQAVVPGAFYTTAACDYKAVGNMDTVYFQPNDAWQSGHTYVIVLKAGLKDATIGNALLADTQKCSFKIADITSVPKVVSTSITDGAANVDQNAVFTVKFSAPMNKALVETNDASHISLSATVQSTVYDVPCDLSYDATSTTVTVTPKNYLARQTKYTLTIGTGCQFDNRAIGMASNVTKTFTVNDMSQALPKVTGAKWTTTSSSSGAGYLTITLDKPCNLSSGSVDNTFKAMFDTTLVWTGATTYTIDSTGKVITVRGLTQDNVSGTIRSASGSSAIPAYSNNGSTCYFDGTAKPVDIN